MKIKRFYEEVGFDDEEMRDRLEIPNLRGELEPNSLGMRTYSLPSTKVNSDTEVRKLVFREPILDKFRLDTKVIEGSKLISFFATSKAPVDGIEYYAQLSFAFHQDQYYIGTVIRNREDFENEDNWVKHTFFFNDIEETFKIADAFVKICQQLNIVDRGDLEPLMVDQN
jgi:hypothetical protein